MSEELEKKIKEKAMYPILALAFAPELELD